MNRAALLVLPLTLAATLLAASDRAPRAPSTPTIAPVATRTAEATTVPPKATATIVGRITPTPVRSVGEARPAGAFVLRTGDGLQIYRFSGRPETTRLGGASARYGGYASAAGALFFSEEASPGTWRAVKVDLRSGERMVTLEVRANYLDIGPNRSGTALAYATGTATTAGTYMLEFSTGRRRVLREQDRSSCPTNRFACIANQDPRWSPDGRFIVVSRTGYEDYGTWAVDLVGETPRVLELKLQRMPHFAGEWRPAGGALCMQNGGYGGGPTAQYVFDLVALTGLPLSEPPPDARGDRTSPTGCSWSQAGELAASFGRGTWFDGANYLRLLNRDSSPQATYTDVPDEVIAWLPDSSGVVMRHDTHEGEFANDRPYFVVDRSGRVRALALPPGELLDILPE